MGRTPKEFTDEQISFAVNEIKVQRPDIWEKWVSFEKNNGGYKSILTELYSVVIPLGLNKNVSELNDLMFELRKRARVEAGMPL